MNTNETYVPRIWASADLSKNCNESVNITKKILNLLYYWVKLWFKFK